MDSYPSACLSSATSGEAQDTTYTVLIAEDNPQHLELLETYLESMPELRVISAVNGDWLVHCALARIESTLGVAFRSRLAHVHTAQELGHFILQSWRCEEYARGKLTNTFSRDGQAIRLASV